MPPHLSAVILFQELAAVLEAEATAASSDETEERKQQDIEELSALANDAWACAIAQASGDVRTIALPFFAEALFDATADDLSSVGNSAAGSLGAFFWKLWLVFILFFWFPVN